MEFRKGQLVATMQDPAASQNEGVDAAVLQSREKTVKRFTDGMYSSCREVPTSELLQYADEVKGKVVLVTGT